MGAMDVPPELGSLPMALYVLAFDRRKGSVTTLEYYFGHVLRAAAAAELLLSRQIEDRGGGQVVLADNRSAASDPTLESVRNTVAAAGAAGCSWAALLDTDYQQTIRSVQAQLASNGTLKRAHGRILGALKGGGANGTLAHPSSADSLLTTVLALIRGADDDVAVPPRMSALAALAVDGGIRTVHERIRAGHHNERVAELGRAAGRDFPALQIALQVSNDQQRTGGIVPGVPKADILPGRTAGGYAVVFGGGFF